MESTLRWRQGLVFRPWFEDRRRVVILEAWISESDAKPRRHLGACPSALRSVGRDARFESDGNTPTAILTVWAGNPTVTMGSSRCCTIRIRNGKTAGMARRCSMTEAGEIMRAVRPRPNRIVSFDASMPHVPDAPPAGLVPALRVTVAYKLERAVSPRLPRRVAKQAAVAPGRESRNREDLRGRQPACLRWFTSRRSRVDAAIEATAR